MLNMDPVVKVNVSVGASPVPSGVFDVGAILTASTGTEHPLSASNRFAEYDSLATLENGTATLPAFASSTDVYMAAVKYFGVTPAPSKLVVIWYDTAENTTETPVTALLDAINNGAEFYGVYYSPKPSETAANIKTYLVGIASALDSLNRGVLFYGATGTATDLIDASGLFSTLKGTGTRRAFGMACVESIDDAAGFMGLAMGYGRTARESAFALCYKSIASAAVNSFSQSNVEAIKAVNGNVYVARTKDRAGLENGASASGMRYDEVLFVDMIAHDIQNNLYVMIAENVTKLPQKDSTTTLFISEINGILEGYYNIGVLADAVWHGNNYAEIEEGTVIEHGYTAFADLFDNQSVENRAAHKAMPITVLICLSGSVESIVINLDVQT